MFNEVNDYDDAPFRQPGSKSALRAGRRVYPCPTCEEPNMLTIEDIKRHYQCDSWGD